MAFGLQSLAGSLTPQGVLDAAQAQEVQSLAENAARAKAASDAAAQAGQQYQQAAAAPAPQVDALSAFLPTLFGHIAATLARDPSYVERAHEQLAAQQNDLLRVRAQNLQALHDQYQQQAETARTLGNQQAELEARSKMETTARAFQQVLTTQQEQAANERTKLQGQNALNVAGVQGKTARDVEAMRAAAGIKEAGIRASTAAADNVQGQLDQVTKTLPDGTKYVDIQQFGAKLGPAFRKAALDSGVLPLSTKDSGKLADIETARLNLQQAYDAVAATAPKDAAGRILLSPSIKVAQVFQTKDDLAAYNSLKSGAIQYLKALVAGGGVRINQAEIKTQLDGWLKPNDTIGALNKRMEFLNGQLDNATAPIIGRKLKRPATTSGVPATGEKADFEFVPGQGVVKAGG